MAKQWLITIFFLIVVIFDKPHSQSTGTPPGRPIGKVILPAIVRDFREYNVPGGHPDFENASIYWNRYKPGSIAKKIGTNGKHSSIKMDNRNPVFVSSVANGGPYSGETFFNHWYNDMDTSINRPFLINLEFTLHDNCILTFLSDNFFPLDDGKVYCSLNDPPVKTFGHLQTNHPEHNFSFTMEFHTKFTYIRGADQIFSFKGDDDVWVFINDSLVIDIGGVHASIEKTVRLDDLRRGFLRDGHKYTLDFFSAERHVTGSRIRIETSILLNMDFGGIFGKTKAQKGRIITCFGHPIEVRSPELVCDPAVPNKNISTRYTTSRHIGNVSIAGNNIKISTNNKAIDLPNKIVLYSLQGKLITYLHSIYLSSPDESLFRIPSRIPSGIYLIYNNDPNRTCLGKISLH